MAAAARLSLTLARYMQLKHTQPIKPLLRGTLPRSITTGISALRPTIHEPLHGRSRRQQSIQVVVSKHRPDRRQCIATYRHSLDDSYTKHIVSKSALRLAAEATSSAKHLRTQNRRRKEPVLFFWATKINHDLKTLNEVWHDRKASQEVLRRVLSVVRNLREAHDWGYQYCGYLKACVDRVSLRSIHRKMLNEALNRNLPGEWLNDLRALERFALDIGTQLEETIESHWFLSSRLPCYCPISDGISYQPSKMDYTLVPVHFSNVIELANALTNKDHLTTFGKEASLLKDLLSGVRRAEGIANDIVRSIAHGVSSFLANHTEPWFHALQFAQAAEPWIERIFDLRADLAQPAWKWAATQNVLFSLMEDLQTVYEVFQPLVIAQQATQVQAAAPSPIVNVPNVVSPAAPSDKTPLSTSGTDTPLPTVGDATTLPGLGGAYPSSPTDVSPKSPPAPTNDVFAAMKQDIVDGTNAYAIESVKSGRHLNSMFANPLYSTVFAEHLATLKNHLATHLVISENKTRILLRACNYVTHASKQSWFDHHASYVTASTELRTWAADMMELRKELQKLSKDAQDMEGWVLDRAINDAVNALNGVVEKKEPRKVAQIKKRGGAQPPAQ